MLKKLYQAIRNLALPKDSRGKVVAQDGQYRCDYPQGESLGKAPFGTWYVVKVFRKGAEAVELDSLERLRLDGETLSHMRRIDIPCTA